MTDVTTLFNRLHAFFMSLEYLNICAFSRTEGLLKYLQELEQFRSGCPGLPFLMAADRAIRKKIFRLLSEQRATYTAFSQALLEVLNNHKYLWNDARTSVTLSKVEHNRQQLISNPDQVQEEGGLPPVPHNPFKRTRGGKKKKRLQTAGKEETPKKVAKEDPNKKPKRDDGIPEKEWKLIADAAKKVQGARRCHYFNSLGCISGDSCRFKHLCMVCGEPHAMIGYCALLDNYRVMRRVTEADIQRWKDQGWTVEKAPLKAVCTRKAVTGRRRARLVVCGNYVGPGVGGDRDAKVSPSLQRKDLYTPSLDISALRLQLKHAAECGYEAGCTDISKAFLNAPLDDLMSKGRLVIAQSPRILERVGVLSKPEQYVLLGALYGLDASPRAWGTHRDSKLRRLTWRSSQGELCRLRQLRSEPCLWRVETESGRMLGYVGVYVDDLLCTGETQTVKEVFSALQSLWECSDVELASETDLKFCGLQLQRRDGVYYIHQGAYLEELFAKHGVTTWSTTPVLKEELVDGEKVVPEELRAGQALAGELLWVSTRTRPDICYALAAPGPALWSANVEVSERYGGVRVGVPTIMGIGVVAVSSSSGCFLISRGDVYGCFVRTKL